MSHFDKIDLSKGIDPPESNNSKEYIICHYWDLIMGSNFKILFVMAVLIWQCCFNISDIAIITIKRVDYCCIIHDISKSKAIHLLENSVLDDRGYIKYLAKKSILNFVYKTVILKIWPK